jgi:23S rRNA pseudouridine2605 synthase
MSESRKPPRGRSGGTATPRGRVGATPPRAAAPPARPGPRDDRGRTEAPVSAAPRRSPRAAVPDTPPAAARRDGGSVIARPKGRGGARAAGRGALGVDDPAGARRAPRALPPDIDAPARRPRRAPGAPAPGATGPRATAPTRGTTSARSVAGASGNTSTPVGDGSQKLQKVLAQAGLGSRREMEALIAAGKVLVNGVAAGLGDRVRPDDEVKVGRRHIRYKLSARLPRVIVYHKPEGEIVSRSDPEGRASVFERLPAIRSGKWLAIGRLDFNTCGLLIFTTSGELANRMTHPRFEVEREYAVRVMGALTPEQMRDLCDGVKLVDGLARFDLLETQGGQGANHWYRVVVREGRNRLVRRMFEHFGLTVSRLMRTRFGIVNMPPRLKRGQHLELTEAQTRMILDWLATGRTAAAPRRAAPHAAEPFDDDGPDHEPVPARLPTGAPPPGPRGGASAARTAPAGTARRPRGTGGAADLSAPRRGPRASAETPRRPRRPSRAR